jgi:hypothetical protein
MIFFVQIETALKKSFGFHAEADTVGQAEVKTVDFFKRRYGQDAKVTDTRPALRQNKKRYSFPDMIL